VQATIVTLYIYTRAHNIYILLNAAAAAATANETLNVMVYSVRRVLGSRGRDVRPIFVRRELELESERKKGTVVVAVVRVILETNSFVLLCEQEFTDRPSVCPCMPQFCT